MSSTAPNNDFSHATRTISCLSENKIQDDVLRPSDFSNPQSVMSFLTKKMAKEKENGTQKPIKNSDLEALGFSKDFFKLKPEKVIRRIIEHLKKFYGEGNHFPEEYAKLIYAKVC